MDGNAAFRRAMHIVSPIFLSYYLLPEQLGAGITRTSVTLLFLGTAACIEIARIALGIRLFGMRPYEGKRVSAYAQGALGLALAFFLFGDLLGTRAPYLVVPVFLGMAWKTGTTRYGARVPSRSPKRKNASARPRAPWAYADTRLPSYGRMPKSRIPSAIRAISMHAAVPRKSSVTLVRVMPAPSCSGRR